MDVFALLFIVSFLALIFTLVVMHIRKCMNKGKGVFVEQTNLGYGVAQWDLSYEAHDLIGETSHKTDKLVIKWG